MVNRHTRRTDLARGVLVDRCDRHRGGLCERDVGISGHGGIDQTPLPDGKKVAIPKGSKAEERWSRTKKEIERKSSKSGIARWATEIKRKKGRPLRERQMLLTGNWTRQRSSGGRDLRRVRGGGITPMV